MKKIIAISMMLALIAGAVFADTTVSGAVETRFSLAKQTGAKNADPVMGGTIGAAQIRLTGSNSDGTLGGMFNLRNTDIVRSWNSWDNPKTGDNWKGPWYHRVFAWWKPIEQIKVFLGIDQDGLFDTCDFVGWGFHSGDNDYIFNHHWDFWRQIFPGNWDGFGLAVSVYPIQGLDFNLVFPTGGVNWPQANVGQVEKNQPITNTSSKSYDGMIPGRLRFSGNFGLDFGKISFVYLGGTGVSEKGTAGYGTIAKDNNGLVGLSFLLTAIDSIQIKVGGSAILTDPDILISAGLGVAWSGDGFGVKFRAGMMMQGDTKMFLTADVLPYFNVGEKGQILVDIQISQDGNKKSPTPTLGWGVTPAYRLGIDGGAFKIGIQVYNNINAGGNCMITGADYIKWNVPMLLSFNF